MASDLNRHLNKLAIALLVLPTVSLFPLAALAEIRGPECRGILLQLNLRESGESPTESFRFNLRLEAEAPTSAAALDQLGDRQDRLRQQLEPLVQGRLVIPAPNTYEMAGSKSSSGFRAVTTITGTVGRGNYDTLIQRAGRLPGVRLQGMTSLPSSSGQNRLQDKLLDSVEGAENAPYDPRREAGILRLLNELRGEHSVRYANSKDRQAAQQTRTFSRASAAHILALDRGPRAKVPQPVPVDPRLLMWPVMNFYRPPPPHRRVASLLNPEQWGGRTTLGERVRDRVLLSRSAPAIFDAAESKKKAAARASAFTKRFREFTAKKGAT